MGDKKVLVVEDQEDMRLLYRVMFRRETRIEVLEAESGESALSIVAQEVPDLILTDITLPGMSGIDLTRIVKRDFPAMKVMVITGHDASRFYDQAMNAGADDLVIKGDMAQIVAAAKKLIGI